jgi:hypothetical protein
LNFLKKKRFFQKKKKILREMEEEEGKTSSLFCDQFEKEDLERAYRDLDVNGDGEVDCKDFSEVRVCVCLSYDRYMLKKKKTTTDRSRIRRGCIRQSFVKGDS